MFDTGKLLQDEEKEDVHVGKGTYKQIIDMAGGYKFMALLCCAQFLSEFFEYLGQNIKNNWASEEAKDQQSQYW